MKIEDIRGESRYHRIGPVTPAEQQALEAVAVADGEIYEPLFVWRSQKVLVYGYPAWHILKAHPDLKYTVRQFEFEDFQEAEAWAVEHYISQPEVRLARKLEVAMNCESYWILKENAKKAHGRRRESPSDTEGNSAKSMEVNAIIAQKVGCSATTVYNFKRVYQSGRTDIVRQVRKGEMSISKAYALLFTPKKAKKIAPSSAPISVELGGADILAACRAKVPDAVGRARYPIPVDPTPVVEQMNTAKVPPESVWIAVHPQASQIQVLSKTLDEATGNVRTVVNGYDYTVVSKKDDVIILQATRMGGAESAFSQKDSSDYDDVSKKAL